jgi:hypothetical protein
VLPSGTELYVQDATGKVHWIYTTHIAELTHDATADEEPTAASTPRP